MPSILLLLYYIYAYFSLWTQNDTFICIQLAIIAHGCVAGLGSLHEQSKACVQVHQAEKDRVSALVTRAFDVLVSIPPCGPRDVMLYAIKSWLMHITWKHQCNGACVCARVSTHMPCAQWKDDTHERQASKSCNDWGNWGWGVGGRGRRSGGDLTQEALLGDKTLETRKCMSVHSHRHVRSYRSGKGGETGFDVN